MTDNDKATKATESETKSPKKKKGGKSNLITALVILGIIVILVGGGAGYFNYINNTPLPKVDGNVKVNGLYDKVEVIRDSNGIPHIYATNMHDLNFAQGYIQAQDRWWQMEMFRHICGGRIEELTGKRASLVSSDIYLRTLGWYRVAQQEYTGYTPEQRAPLDAFAAGVNAYISKRSPQDLSVNYSILGLTGVKFEIEPWTPVDTLAFGKLMCYDLGYSGDEEIQRSKLYTALGQATADKWETPPWGYGEKPTIIQESDVQAMDKSESPAATSGDMPSTSELPVTSIQAYDDPRPDLSRVMGPSAGIGSNNWVVSGNLTQSGKPLLANDPHLGIQMPSIWYEIGLHCPDDGSGRPYDVVGFAFAPSPGVIIGHNNNISWGVTNVYPDVHDHYQIKINPDNPLQYEWNGAWRDMTVSNETINFGDGSSPISFKVRQTHLGPIINDNKYDAATGQFFGFNNKDPLALRWTALDPGTLVSAINGIDTAANWNEFRNALRNWDGPSQNFVYADKDGNIGYQMPGKVPIRSKNHSGLLPVPGWTDEFEWQGYIPFDLLPRAYNPERGYIITANQAVVPPSYYDFLKKHLNPELNYNLGYEWNYGYRGQRIEQLINSLAPHSIETFQKIQGDNKVLSVGEILPYLANVKLGDPTLTDAKNWLVHWDQTFDVDSPQAALYAEFWMKLVNNTVQDQLDDIIKSEGDDRDMWAIYQMLKNPDDIWWDDVRTKDKKETRDEILAKSFKEGYEAAVADLGPDRSQWKWGKLHTATFVSNPLGASGIGLLESLVNRGPYPAGGNTDAVNACSWRVDKGDFKITMIPSMRMIIDWSDLSKSITVNNTGQSGHPASQWYDNMIKRWLNIEYHPMLWTRDQVNSNSTHKLVLTP